MVELVSGALRMLTEQVGKIEKRLDEYHTRLKILEDDFDEIIDKDTATPSCECKRSEESDRSSDHHPKRRRTISRSSHRKIRCFSLYRSLCEYFC